MPDKPEGFESIEEYIAAQPENIQSKLIQIRETINKAAPQAKEKISYGMPSFVLNGSLVYFGVSKNHIGFYPTPSAISAFEKELVGYKWAKGSVQFPLDKPIPLDLIHRMTEFRVEENMKKAKAKKSKKL